ncbi:MAG TPA: hypothetical protein VFQ76_12400, partial [Longimicrobiaceae bacterium]|nr:hypothetical protein [Longimicrobiaceae bacterium]
PVGGRRRPDAAFISAGVSGIATEELDDRLAARGYPTFGSTATAVGFGGYWGLPGGWMLGGEFNGLIIGDEPHQGRTVGLGGGYATLGVGYAVELSPRVRLYPRLGLGAGGLALWFESDDTVGFDEVLADPGPLPGRQPVLSHDGVVVDLGAGAELLPGGRGRGPLIGVRLGYLAALFGSDSDWQLYEYTASGGPPATIAGPYVRAVVGVGRRR